MWFRRKKGRKNNDDTAPLLSPIEQNRLFLEGYSLGLRDADDKASEAFERGRNEGIMVGRAQAVQEFKAAALKTIKRGDTNNGKEINVSQDRR